MNDEKVSAEETNPVVKKKDTRWWRACRQERSDGSICGTLFPLTEETIDQYRRKGLETPQRCPACRKYNKMRANKKTEFVEESNENIEEDINNN